MKDSSFENRLSQGDWWEEGNECLNMTNVNKPPAYYDGTEQEWIEELTSYAYSFPKEWKRVYEQYFGKMLDPDRIVLQFYRTDDGYLRKEGLEDVYLKIVGRDEPLSHEVLDHIGRILSEREGELWRSVQEYAVMDGNGRTAWKEKMKDEIQSRRKGVKISVSVVDSLDESSFLGNELYFDMLNGVYVIL